MRTHARVRLRLTVKRVRLRRLFTSFNRQPQAYVHASCNSGRVRHAPASTGICCMGLVRLRLGLEEQRVSVLQCELPPRVRLRLTVKRVCLRRLFTSF